MMKKCFVSLFVLAVVAVAGISCQREEIEYPVSNYYVSLSVTPNPLQKEFSMPPIYSANFYDMETGKLSYSTYLRTGFHPARLPEGGYVTGLVPGDYKVLVYNFDLRRSSVIDRQVYERAYAEAEILSRSNDVAVTDTPDNLYVYSDQIKVPYVTAKDDIFIIDAAMKDIVECWTVRVEGVKNANLAEKITFYMSGQSAGKYLSNSQMLKERSIVTFLGHVEEAVFHVEDNVQAVDSVGTKAATDSTGFVMVGDYTSYGALESVDRILLTIHVVGPNGSNYFEQIDVTDQVRNPENVNHIVNTVFDVEIKEREDGGFSPTANPWNPDHTVIILE